VSTELYLVGIWWDGQKGRAKHDGVEAKLRHAPVLGALTVDRTEFNPALHIYTVAERACDPRRDMTPDEIEEAHLWLLRMSGALRQVIG
jgi:hypothetical protein